jgi:hypothetical protein
VSVTKGGAGAWWVGVLGRDTRLIVSLASITLFTVGSAIVAISNTIGLLIGMRVVQAAGWALPFYSFPSPNSFA